MRCRKVRSFLSAYCNDELSERRKLAVSEHLSTCSTCRKEEAIYYSLNKANSDIPGFKISDNFNVELLNRIARERFTQTRTKAFTPKPAPLMVWSKAIPAFVSVCLIVLMTIVAVSPGLRKDVKLMALNKKVLDDSYLTVQPVNNPNLTINMGKSWSFDDQLARAERINKITNTLARTGSFDFDNGSSGLSQVSSSASDLIPYVSNYYRMRSVVRIYVIPETSSGKEAVKVY